MTDQSSAAYEVFPAGYAVTFNSAYSHVLCNREVARLRRRARVAEILLVLACIELLAFVLGWA